MGKDRDIFININEHLVCPICLDVLDDAAMAPCGHNCCFECWYKVFRTASARNRTRGVPCPVCRSEIPWIPVGSIELFRFIANLANVLKKNIVITQMINDWTTKCHWRGCTESVKYSDRSNHFNTCAHKTVPKITFRQESREFTSSDLYRCLFVCENGIVSLGLNDIEEEDEDDVEVII